MIPAKRRLRIGDSWTCRLPVVLRDAGPEDPYHDHREKRKQRFEQGSVNFA